MTRDGHGTTLRGPLRGWLDRHEPDVRARLVEIRNDRYDAQRGLVRAAMDQLADVEPDSDAEVIEVCAVGREDAVPVAHLRPPRTAAAAASPPAMVRLHPVGALAAAEPSVAPVTTAVHETTDHAAESTP